MSKLKKISIFVVAECFKALFRLLMFALVVYVAGVIIAIQTKKKPVEDGTYIELKLAEQITESKTITPFDLKKEMNFYGLLKNIKKAKIDSRIHGLILNFDNIRIDKAQIEELTTELEKFKKSGKKIFAYAPSYTNNNYLIASVANKIIMPDTMSAISDIKGYYLEIPYYKKLGDRLGLKMNVVHIGRYKSAGENYCLEDMSPEFKKNTQQILDSTYDNFISKISKNRNIDKNTLDTKILNGDFVLADPKTMLDNKLIDEIIYYDNFLEKNNISKEKVIGITEYISRLTADDKENDKEIKENRKKDKIAIIYAEGTIKYSDYGKELDMSVTPKGIQKKLEIAEKDPLIKGIVVRINSPGGSALASDIIYNSIRNIKKPVYVSMGGVAASGGYYIASAGDKIYADNDTVTGSIGVVTMIPNASELVNKFDVNYSTISKGEYNHVGNLVHEMTPKEKEKIYISSLKVYDEFVSKVAAGRHLSKDDIYKIAEGKVWLGKDALNIGLVDKIGGIEKAISDMADSLDLKDYTTIESPKEEKIESVIKNYLPKYLMAKVIEDNKLLKTFIPKEIISEELLYRPVLYAPTIFSE